MMLFRFLNQFPSRKLSLYLFLSVFLCLFQSNGALAQTQDAYSSQMPQLSLGVSPGQHLVQGGNCLIAGGVFVLLGAGAITTAEVVSFNKGHQGVSGGAVRSCY